jgi:hypothetical protein
VTDSARMAEAKSNLEMYLQTVRTKSQKVKDLAVHIFLHRLYAVQLTYKTNENLLADVRKDK